MEENRYSVGILAGGKSSRMGTDKASLVWQGKSLLERLIDEFSDVGEILVSEASEKTDHHCGHRTVYDERKETGPIEGIRQILKASSTEYVFICAVDMPFLKKEVFYYLEQFLYEGCPGVCIKDEEHIHPLCGIYKKSLLPLIEKQSEEGNYRLMEWIRAGSVKIVSSKYACFSKKMLWNANTIEEWGKTLPHVFAVSGVKNSGKTTLAEKLIRYFTAEGLTVGAIKHDGHDFTMDQEGTDTDRLSKAGAVLTAIYSDSHYAYVGKGKKSLDEIMDSFPNVDLLLIEGCKKKKIPRVEVIRSINGIEPVCDLSTCICLATDDVKAVEKSEKYWNYRMEHKDWECPVYSLNDIEKIAGRIRLAVRNEGRKEDEK